MKAFGAMLLVVGIAVSVSTVVSAQTQCGLFAPDRACQVSRSPLSADFGKDIQKVPGSEWVVVQKRPTEAKPAATPVPAQPIDCQMVRHVEHRTDPVFVKAPPPGVKHALRVTEMPQCPRK